MQYAEIVPIAYSNVGWQEFIKVCKDDFGFDPTVVLSKNNVELKDPTAFICALNTPKEPNKTLEQSVAVSHLLEHSWLSVLSRIKSTDVEELRNKLFVNILSGVNNCPELIVLSGTIRQWLMSIVSGCHESSDKTTNHLCSNVMDLLMTTKYKILFDQFQRIRTADNRWILLKR